MSDFLDKLDDALGLKPKEETPQPQLGDIPAAAPTPTPTLQPVPEATPEDDFEPVKEPDPEDVPKEPDPFATAIDDALRAEGVDVDKELRRKYDPAKGDLQTHDWKMEREALFSDEAYKFRCKRCLKWVTVAREQTIGQALVDQQIEPNCAAQIVQDIQAQ